MGGYERDSAPWSLDEHLVDRIPPDFNGRLLEEDWPRFEEIAENASKVRVPAMEDVKVTRLINGPEAFTPDNEFCLGESEVRGFFVAAGFCAHGLAGAGGIGKVMAEWIARGRAGARRVGDGHPALRPAVPLAVLHAQARQGGLRDLLRHPLPGRRAPGRPPAARLERLRLARRARRGLRREVRLGARQLVRAQRAPDGRRVAAPARLGRDALVAGDRRRARRARASAAALFDESSFAKLEIAGPGAAEFLEGLCDNRVARDVGAITYTQMLNRARRDRVRLHRHARGGGAVLDRHRHGVRQARPRLDPPARARRTGRCACTRRHRALGVLRAVGPARPRHPRAADGRPARLPLHAHARASRSATCRCARCASRSSASSAGSSTARPSTAPACGARCGRPGEPHGLVAGGYRAIDSLRLEKGYRVWARRHHARRRRRSRPGSASACKRDKAASSARDALDAAARRRRRRCAACVLDDPRSVALGNEPVRVGGEIVGRVTSGGYGYTVERSIAYAYAAAGRRASATAVEVDIFGEWVRGRGRGRAALRSGRRARALASGGCPPSPSDCRAP